MKNGFSKWSEFYQKLSMVFNGIIALSLLPFAWIYLEIENGGRDAFISGNLLIGLQLLCFLLVAVILYYGYTTFQKDLDNVDKSEKLKEKIDLYYKIAVKRYLIYEVAAIICMIITFVSAQIWFAVLYVFILFVFSLARPKFDLVVRHLKLNKEEQDLLARDQAL